MKNNCNNGCSLPSSDNELEILIRQLKQEVKELLETTTARLLCQDKKIAETCVYIKNNLSNAIRDLLESMQTSGELDDIITDAISNEIALLQNKVSNIYDIAEFGAIGDGVTNDALAIQNALATNLNEDKIIKFKDKVYGAKGTLYLYSNTTLELNNATIKDLETDYNDINRDSAGLRFLNNVPSMKKEGYGALKNITVKNGTFEGCSCGVLFALFHGENIEFNNITFSNCCMGTHIFDLGGCKNVRFINCRFVGCSLPSNLTYREMIQPDYAHYRGLPYWTNNPEYAYDELPTTDLLVKECLFEIGDGSTYPNAIGTHGSLTGKHTNIKIYNNVFKDCTYACIRLPRVDDLFIKDNIFINENATGSERSFIWLEQGYASGVGISNKNIIIENNVIKTNIANTNIYFARIWGDGNEENFHRDIVIKNNMYHGTYNSTNTGSDFLQIGNVKDVIVEGNIINRAKNVIFNIGSTIVKGLSILGNRMVNCRTFVGVPSTSKMNNRIAKNNSWEENGTITYRINNLFEQIYSSEGQGSGVIELSSGVNHFDYILVATGGIGNQTYMTVPVYPFDVNAGFRVGEDTYTINTATGKTIFKVTDDNKLTIISTNDLVRKIIGIKIL